MKNPLFSKRKEEHSELQLFEDYAQSLQAQRMNEIERTVSDTSIKFNQCKPIDGQSQNSQNTEFLSAFVSQVHEETKNNKRVYSNDDPYGLNTHAKDKSKRQPRQARGKSSK